MGPLPPELFGGGRCVGAEDVGLEMTGDGRVGGPLSEGRWGVLRLAVWCESALALTSSV